MITPKSFIDILKTPPRYAYIGLLSIGILKFTPIWDTQKEYANWLTLLGVIFFSIAIVHIAIGIWSMIQKVRNENLQRSKLEDRIKSITQKEKDFLGAYFRHEVRTLELGVNFSEVQNLVHLNIIFQTEKPRSVAHDYTVLADFSVSDWAWEVINNNSSLREWVELKS